MHVILEILEGPSVGRRISLHTGQEIIVGRTEYADFVMSDDLQLSGKHFRLVVTDPECSIQDLGSTNGTFVNDEKIDQESLSHNDIIRAGTTKFRVILAIDEPAMPVATPKHLDPDKPSSPSPIDAPEIPSMMPMTVPAVDDEVESQPGTPPTSNAATGGTLPEEESNKGLTTHSIEGAKIEVIGGPSGGRSMWLRNDQRIQVGRTENSDFVVPTDSMLSSVHFLLVCKTDYCSITALSQTNPTLVNDQEVEVQILRDGDRIRAGGTDFSVNIMRGSDCGDRLADALPPIVGSVQTNASEPQFTTKDCHSGMKIFRPAGDLPEAFALLNSLARLVSVHAVVDPSKLEGKLPTPTKAEYVFDWFPSEIVAGNSPIFLAEIDEATFHAAWCCDALICFLSTKSREEILAHFRSIARYDPGSGENSRNAVLGCFWPSLLVTLLANSYRESAEHLLSGIEGVFVENHETGVWQIVGRDDFSFVLENCGLAKAVSEL